MKRIKWLLACACVLLLAGCQEESTTTNVVKEGTLYEVGTEVDFYYPSSFTLTNQADDAAAIATTSNTIQFQDDDELLIYMITYDATENTSDEKKVFYVSELEQYGATGVTVSQPILESGITVYEVTGYYNDIGMRFKHIVYFSEDKTYIYAYRADTATYESRIDYITTFLKTLTIDKT